MTPRHRFFYWLVAMLFGFGVLGAILTTYLPQPIPDRPEPLADRFVMLVLYASLFLFLLGLGALIGQGLAWWRERPMSRIGEISLARQAALVAVGLTTLLALQGFRVLSWWDGILLVLALILVELSFHTRSTP